MTIKFSRDVPHMEIFVQVGQYDGLELNSPVFDGSGLCDNCWCPSKMLILQQFFFQTDVHYQTC